MTAPVDLLTVAREIALSVTGVGPSRVEQAAQQIAEAMTRTLQGHALSTREAILFRLIEQSQAENLDLSHEWAQWNEKWHATLDTLSSTSGKLLAAEAEVERLRARALASEPSGERESLPAVIHHMTLMLNDFGQHEPECCCAADEARHAADCKDCECGLAEAIAFGVEQSGLSLEPTPDPEEEARLHEIGVRIVNKLLAPPAPPSVENPREVAPLIVDHAFRSCGEQHNALRPNVCHEPGCGAPAAAHAPFSQREGR